MARTAREDVFSERTPRTWPALALLAKMHPSMSTLQPANEALLKSIRRLIREAQTLPKLSTARRIRQAIAHLWAASDAVEGISN